MLVATLPFDGQVPRFDVTPLAAIVERAAEQKPIAEIKSAIDAAVRTLSEGRLTVSETMRFYLGALSAAELEGWQLDVDPVVRLLEQSLSNDRRSIRPAREALRKAIDIAVARHVPGANTLHGYAQRATGAIDAWTNDLEDYVHELKEIQKRMRIYKQASSPITRAEAAYKRALVKCLQLSEEPTSTTELTGMDMIMRVSATVRPELLDDPEALLEAERSVHDEVELEDPLLVGKVALSYAVVGH